jgi:tetratricopeptide (TPR) repeat protein
MAKMKTFIMRCCGFAFIVVIAVSAEVFSQGQTPSPAMQAANAVYAGQKGEAAARAYDEITREQPSNAMAWTRLGLSLHSLGKYDRAVEAFQKAVAIGNGPFPMFNMARSYARLGDKDRAFEWLDKALNAGFPQAARVDTDADLSSLRGDPRFEGVKKLAVRIATPCLALPEYKLFDFWIGEWDVMIQGQVVGTNSVQRIVDGCIILENWSATQGGTGKSFNYYDSNTGKWHQDWVGSGGGVLHLSGGYKDGAMRYEGVTVARNGSKTLERLTFFNLGPDRVRQFWEQSNDEGKTWTVTFDGMYVRKKS